MNFLYDLPDWLMGVCIVGAIVLLSFAFYFPAHTAWRRPFSDDEKNAAMTALQVIATINSLLLAFVAVSVWQSFDEADAAVVHEANTVSQLARDLAVFDSAQSLDARRTLREYAEMVVTVEWRDMGRGESNAQAWDAFDQIYVAVGTLEPDTPRREALLPEIWTRANDLLDHRRTRIHTSESEVPTTLWMVVLIGTALTIGTTVVLSPTRFNLWTIGLLAASMGLVFYLVVTMDRPFAGERNIGPEPFRVAIENMARWDAHFAHKPAGR
jgi:hypothetical protein